jgi:hypothetical protein
MSPRSCFVSSVSDLAKTVRLVQVDEAEPDEALIGTSNASVDTGDTEVTSEHMTEEDLLKGIEGLALVPREEPQEELQEELQEEDANLRY